MKLPSPTERKEDSREKGSKVGDSSRVIDDSVSTQSSNSDSGKVTAFLQKMLQNVQKVFDIGLPRKQEEESIKKILQKNLPE